MNRWSGRRVAVIALLAAGGLGLLSATQPWRELALVDGRTIAATGQQLAGGLTILALACVALALVLPIAGLAWRYALGALAVLLGGLTALHALASDAGADRAVEALVAEATGLAGSAQAGEVAASSASLWPAAAVVAGGLAVGAGLVALVTARRWPARAKRAERYERSGTGLAWDVMDDGEDPTR